MRLYLFSGYVALAGSYVLMVHGNRYFATCFSGCSFQSRAQTTLCPDSYRTIPRQCSPCPLVPSLLDDRLTASGRYDAATATIRSKKRRCHPFTVSAVGGGGNDGDTSGKAKVSLSGVPRSNFFSLDNTTTVTAAIDFVLSLLSSDIGSIVLGLAGLAITLYSRLSDLDYETASVATNAAEAIGQQSRSDILAVFASGALLLNGISKLDITSALAETVVLEGVEFAKAKIIDHKFQPLNETGKDMKWFMEAIIDATPARTSVLMVHSTVTKWSPVILCGVIPSDIELQMNGYSGQSFQILEKVLALKGSQESYLPTLQTLPGRFEFWYLPSNCQDALLLPIPCKDAASSRAILVLGSDTAKSFTSRDVAWCKTIASRIGSMNYF